MLSRIANVSGDGLSVNLTVDETPNTICTTASAVTAAKIYFSLKRFKKSIIFHNFADASAKTPKTALACVWARFFSA